MVSQIRIGIIIIVRGTDGDGGQGFELDQSVQVLKKLF